MAENTVKKQRSGEAEPLIALWFDQESHQFWSRGKKVRSVTLNLPKGEKL